MIDRAPALAAFLFVALSALSSAQGTAETPPPAKPRQVAVLGASVSAGYGTAQPLGVSKPVPLGVFMAATAEDEEAVRFLDLADTGFFSRPTSKGRAMVDKALEAEVSAVIALDFLFWYVNGVSSQRQPRRLAGLEKGLEELSRLDCPLLLGDIPDVRHSLEGIGPMGGPMMRPSMIASEEDRAAVNARIREWAAEHPNVRVLPLGEMMQTIVDGDAVKVRDLTWKPKDLTELLQKDLLHLTPRGTLYTALRIADELAKVKGFEEVPFQWSYEAASTRLDSALEGARAKKAAIEERRRKARERREESRRKKESKGETGRTFAGHGSR